jgi:hypothetical protein
LLHKEPFLFYWRDLERTLLSVHFEWQLMTVAQQGHLTQAFSGKNS